MKLISATGCLAAGCLLGLVLYPSPGILAQAFPQPPRSLHPALVKADVDTSKPLVLSKDLSANGTLVFTMNVADLQILRNDQSNQLRIEIRASGNPNPETLRSWVKRFEVEGDRATVEIHVPSERHNCSSCESSLEVAIYVPKQTALKLELGVGALKIRGIEGDKDVHVGVGDLNVGVKDRGDYARVEISTGIGDLKDELYRAQSEGFLGKSERISQAGRYHLKAWVGVGDVRLVAEEPKS